MDPFNSTMAALVDIAKDLQTARAEADAAKGAINFLKKAELRRRGFRAADIRAMEETWLKDRLHPVYQVSDVQAYIDSRKLKPNKNYL